MTSLSKVNQKKLQFTPQYRDKTVWATWYLLNALDIHSTLKGLKYSCIYEANPTLPKVPHRDHLIIHKALLLSTIFNPNFNFWVDSDMVTINSWLAAAVINNYKITNKVKNDPNCPKR